MTLRAEHYGLAAVVLIVGVAIGKDILKPKNNTGATSNFGSFSPGFRYSMPVMASKKGDCAGPCYLPCNAPCTKKRNSVV